jgi:SAM-dependent methyltransferase
MSFSPLPNLFLEYLERAGGPTGRLLDLGCGDGSFFLPLLHSGVRPVGIDRRGPAAGTVAAVVGDVHQPPVLRGSQDVVVAANLFRHIISDDPLARFLDQWQQLVKPHGALFLFEDEPARGPGPAGNYRDLQSFLCRLMPEARGPLLARSEFENSFGAPASAGCWEFGTCKNELAPDRDAVRRMLEGGGLTSGGEAARLSRAIEQEGLAYGDFWWACWRRNAE